MDGWMKFHSCLCMQGLQYSKIFSIKVLRRAVEVVVAVRCPALVVAPHHTIDLLALPPQILQVILLANPNILHLLIHIHLRPPNTLPHHPNQGESGYLSPLNICWLILEFNFLFLISIFLIGEMIIIKIYYCPTLV